MAQLAHKDNTRRSRNTAGRCYLLRLSSSPDWEPDLFSDNGIVLCREDFINAILFCQDIIEYCVSVEKSYTSSISEFHLHAYIKFVNKLKFSEVLDLIQSLFPMCNNNIQRVKSRRNALKYISKEDTMLYTNIKESELSFFYQLYMFAKRNPIFDHTHPFVVQHCNKYNFLQKYHLDFYKLKSLDNCKLVTVTTCPDVNWCKSVSQWYNDWCIRGWHFKKKQLYLYGPPNMGKSSYIRKILSSIPSGNIFIPSLETFGFQGLDSSHCLILFDDLYIELFESSLLKNLLQGSQFKIKCKGVPAKTFTFKGPVIFVANTQLLDPAYKARFLEVLADEAYYASPEVPAPKVENCPSPLSIASSSDGVSQEVNSPSTSRLSPSLSSSVHSPCSTTQFSPPVSC